MSIIAYGITYLRTILVELWVKSALCQTDLHIQQLSEFVTGTMEKLVIVSGNSLAQCNFRPTKLIQYN